METQGMHQVKQKIKELRPALREVAPLTFYVCIGFCILNVVLGLTLLNSHDAGGLSIVGKYTPLWGYGAVFVMLGLWAAWVLYKNDWLWIRRTLLAGMLYKSIWFYALVATLFKGGSLGIVALWLFLIYVQAMTYVFFIPTVHKRENTNDRPANV